MPNDFSIINNTSNNRWDLTYTVDAAGTKSKTLKTGGTFVDRDILVSITTPSTTRTAGTGSVTLTPGAGAVTLTVENGDSNSTSNNSMTMALSTPASGVYYTLTATGKGTVTGVGKGTVSTGSGYITSGSTTSNNSTQASQDSNTATTHGYILKSVHGSAVSNALPSSLSRVQGMYEDIEIQPKGYLLIPAGYYPKDRYVFANQADTEGETQAASNYSLSISDISGNSAVSVGTKSGDNYPIIANNLSVTGTLTAGTAGWFSSGSATDSDTDNVTIGTMPAAVITASTSANANIAVDPGTVSISSNTTNVSGKTRLGLTPTTSTSGIGTYYVAIQATAAANSTGASTNISGTTTASVTTAGYAPGTLTGTGSISGTAKATTNSKDSSVYYIPITSNVGSIGGTANSGSATAVLTNIDAINTINNITGKTAGTDYWAIKATATTTNGSYTPTYTVTTTGWLNNSVNGTAQTVTVNADTVGQTIYIPKATFAVDGASVTTETAGYVPANEAITSINAVTPTFSGGDVDLILSVTPSNPTVSISGSGTLTTTGVNTYGVTTTTPSGTNGTNYLAISNSVNAQPGSMYAEWSINRDTVLYSNEPGYLVRHTGVTALAGDTINGTDYLENDVNASVSNNFGTYYIPIITPTFSGGTVSGSTTTTITTNMATTSSSDYYIDASAVGTANRAAVTYSNNAGAIAAHTDVTALNAPSTAVDVGSSANRIYIRSALFNGGKIANYVNNYTTTGSASDYDFSFSAYITAVSAGYVAEGTQKNLDTSYYKIKTTSTTQGTTTISSGTVTRGTASWGTGWITTGSISPATFANTATSGKTYVDISDTTSAPVLVSGDYLYINKGYTDDLKISLAKLVPNAASANLASNHMLNGYSAYNNDGVLITGNIPTNDISDITFDGSSVIVAPGNYPVETTKEIGAASITSGLIATVNSNQISYQSANDNFKQIIGYTTANPIVDTPGYISSTIGTKHTQTSGLNITLPKIGLTSEKTSGNLTVSPILSRTAKPSSDTWIDAANGAATLIKPTSGPYVQIDAAANTNDVVIKGKVSSAGYGTTEYYDAADTSYTVGAAAAATRYIPIKEAISTFGDGTITVTPGTANITTTGIVTTDTITPYYFTATATGGSANVGSATLSVTEGYVTTPINVSTSASSQTGQNVSQTKYIPAAVGSVVVTADTSSCTIASDINNTVTLSNTNTSGVVLNISSTSTVTATTSTTAGYTPANNSYATETVTDFNAQNITKYITGVKLIPPATNDQDRVFTLTIPNGSTTDFITFVFTVDSSGNVTIEEESQI